MANGKIEKTVQMYDSHEEADRATAEFYENLTTTERLELALQLMASTYETHPRFERIYRTAELGECPVSSDWGMGVQQIR